MIKPVFSVVIPLYRCSNAIAELNKRLISSISTIIEHFEIIYINDASPENDWEMVLEEAKKDNRIKGINLSRNFGQHYAITAGLQYVTGEWIIVMDGDLQDQPEEILALYKKTKEDFDIVLARRTVRQDSFLKRQSSKWFYIILAYLTDTEQNAEIANFGIYNRNVVDAILSMKDKTRNFPTMVRWVGFKKAEISVTHAQRQNGKSGYTLKALINLALNTILSFSDKPLRLTVKLGVSISALAFMLAAYTLIRALAGQITVSGYSSMIISIWFLSGIIITLVGMLGLYIGRIFDQVKDRPVFIVSQTINIDK